MRETIRNSLQVAMGLSLLLLILQFKSTESLHIPMSLPGCPEKCGEVEIPYPFGIGSDCSISDNFKLSCNTTETNTHTPYMYHDSDNTFYEIVNINLSLGQARMKIPPLVECYNSSNSYYDYHYDFSTTPYWVNNEKNIFAVFGCNALAYLSFNGSDIMTDSSYRVGCLSTCLNVNNLNKCKKSCSGVGCCKTAIPFGAEKFNIQFDERYNNSEVYNISRCSYAMVTADDLEFVFIYSYISNNKLFAQSMPVVFNWAIGTGTCEHAKYSNEATYACKSDNSECVNVNTSRGFGYLCNCSKGYEGNPYLKQGCQDIDECNATATEKNPCSKPAKCHNLPGIYSCSCPFGWRKVDHNTCELNLNFVIGITIATGVGTGAVLLCFSLVFFNLTRTMKVKRNKQLMEKYYKRNHGILVQRLISATEDTTGRMKIFSLEELEKATNNFDQARILGCGGHGTVYKGILSDLRVVAIKRSKSVNQSETDQFINEVVILSQINHRNVVKLLGCCLETEVPLLVNEFISNGTLSDHLHVTEGQSLQWKDRIRIALETARAVSYIQSAASLSVFHRDIKCSNILLDDCLTAKLSDFGASRSIQIDQTGITTIIQGTYGYLDPEYYHTGRLTDKSDVYSFGVILVELLTTEKVNSVGSSSGGGSLIARFMTVMRENRLFEMFDSQIVGEASREQLEQVAALAERCLRLRHEERPGIKEVEVRLEFIWGGSKKYSAHLPVTTTQSLFKEKLCVLNDSMGTVDTSRQYSLEEEVLLSNQFPR